MVTKEDWDNFAKSSIPELEKRGYLNSYKNQQIVSSYGKKESKNWIAIVVILWLLSLGLFYYAGDNDWIKSKITQNVTLKPNTTINNNYEFNPSTENDYNNKFNLTIEKLYITIPENICE